MSEDIVERLRATHPNSTQYALGSMILHDAADEIESLRRENERLRDGLCTALLAVDDGLIGRASNIIMRTLKKPGETL